MGNFVITLCSVIFTLVTDFVVPRTFYILSQFGPLHMLFPLTLSWPVLHMETSICPLGFGIDKMSSEGGLR